jgi:Homeodomain-like domain
LRYASFTVARDRVKQVREVAAAMGVSERTVWRWLKAERLQNGEPVEVSDLLDMDPRCGWCGEELPLPPEATIRLRFCCDAHRQAKHRQRKAHRARHSQ